MQYICIVIKFQRLWNFDFVRFEDCPDVGTNQISIKLKLNRISRDVLYLGGVAVNEVAMDANVSVSLCYFYLSN